jgi:hypothetical protein
MDAQEIHERLSALTDPLGARELTLAVGESAIRLTGLDDRLRARLDPRWGEFVTEPGNRGPRATLRLFSATEQHWLATPAPGELYRLESVAYGERRAIASYHFAVGRDEATGCWRVGISRDADEPLERIVENAVRYVTAVVTAEDGGFAMHAGGVLREGRAYLLAGPSRAGKSTAVRLLAPAVSLGDDFALVLPRPGGWVAPALPFDNRERSPGGPPGELFPVAGIWRLFRSERTRLERLPHAEASLLSCVAFASAMPEHSATLMEQAGRFIDEGRFEHLHFARDADLWSLLLPAGV